MTEEVDYCEVCNEPHEAAHTDADTRRLYECNGTDYVYCEECCSWEEAYRWGDYGTGPYGQTLCPACMEQVSSCQECGEVVWTDDLQWSERTDRALCYSCAEDEESHRELSSDDGEHTFCTCCQTVKRHLDVLRERFHCDCEAKVALNNGAVMILANPLDSIPGSVAHMEFTLPLKEAA